jgi:PAS domain S-box-containing protein
MGAYDYLKKPFEHEELLKRVGNALNQKRLHYEKNVICWELERSEERYQYLVQNSPNIIYILDNFGNFTFVNITIERLIGYPTEQLIGKHFTCIIHPDDVEKISGFFPVTSKNPSPLNMELKLKKYNKDLFLLFEINHLTIELLTTKDGGTVFGIYGVARDVTYRKHLEDQLQQAKKMEAIGTLAGGIAHDFNNILMGIKGYSSLLLTEIDANSPYYSKLKIIERHVQSGANLTKQLLGFARGGKYDLKAANINEIIYTTSCMFGRTKKEIAINYKFEKDIWAVEVDQGQIEQVLLNLYVNASQAMKEGGSVYIETENIKIKARHSEQLNLKPGNYIKITVRDTGAGMDEEVRERVFEPFFTTKDRGRGTGLGLASAYGIIKNHGGNITVHSKKGAGSTFTIYLPVTNKPVLKDEKPSEEILTGSETVLLVDDEETMIDVGTEILETLGYKTLTAKSGREALIKYSQNKDKIDIVIIDLIMPEIGGGELYDKIKNINPGVKALLASGYSVDGDASKILQRGCNGFIQKPFGIKEISHKIREILD